jgi:hypothetical protein
MAHQFLESLVEYALILASLGGQVIHLALHFKAS